MVDSIKKISIIALLFVTCSMQYAFGTKWGTTTAIITDGTDTALVNGNGELYTVSGGHVDDNNSTTTALSADSVFTGVATNIQTNTWSPDGATMP